MQKTFSSNGQTDSVSESTKATAVAAPLNDVFPNLVCLTKVQIEELRPHPTLLVLPPLSPKQKKAQETSVRNHGLLKPILIKRKVVHDSWHLLQSTLAVGKTPVFLSLPEGVEVDEDLSLDLNMAGRCLEKSQRAMIGALIVERKWPSTDKVSARRIAPQVCASPSYILRAIRVLRKDPKTADLVRTGKLDLPDAERKLRVREALEKRIAQANLDPASPDWITLCWAPFQKALAPIPSGMAAAIITDPIYGLQARQHWIDLGVLAREKLRPGGALVVMVGNRTMVHMANAILEGGGGELEFWREITIKLHGQVNSEDGIVEQARRVFVFFKPGKRKDRPETNQFPHELIDDVRGADTVAHPFSQRVEMFEHFVRWFSAPGDLVLEPFAGGGTIVKACQNLGRRCVAAEIDGEAFARMELCLRGKNSVKGAEERPFSLGQDVQVGDPPPPSTAFQEALAFDDHSPHPSDVANKAHATTVSPEMLKASTLGAETTQLSTGLNSDPAGTTERSAHCFNAGRTGQCTPEAPRGPSTVGLSNEAPPPFESCGDESTS